MPVTKPTDVGSFAEAVYDHLEPYTYADEEHDWHLLIYCGANGQIYQQMDQFAHEGPNGEPPWSALLDIDRIPDEGLPYLGQFVGVRVNTSLSAADQRLQIRELAGFRRGTKPALLSAVKATLTGSQIVLLYERDTSAYHFKIVTYDSQTPDPVATEAAIMSQKPATVFYEYEVRVGQDYAQLDSRFASFTDLDTAYSTFNEIRDDTTPVAEQPQTIVGGSTSRANIFWPDSLDSADFQADAETIAKTIDSKMLIWQGSGLLADRPAAASAGRIYYATDTAMLYFDNGSTWIILG